MGEGKPFEPVRKIRPGDEVIRRRVKPRTRLRIGPRVPEAIRFLKVMITQTPLIPMLSITAVLWILFSTGFYFAEVGAPGTGIESYGQALWAGVVLMTTAGTIAQPVTTAGYLVGGFWTVIGCLLFYGTIIASVTTYIAKRRRRTERQIIETIEDNLERLERLSADELETLKETTDVLIDEHINRLKERGGSTD